MKAKQFKWLVTTIMLVAAMVMPSAAWAYNQPVKGDGTKDNPYRISSSSELFWFAGLVNGTLGDVAQNTDACAELTEDITVGSEWTPIMGFNGTFDGKGYAISNLRYDHTYSGGSSGTSGIGLFGIADSNSEIRNVGIVNCYFRGAAEVGGVCGGNYGGTIKNCYVTGTVNCGGPTFGGICGYNEGTIENCYSTATVGTDGSGPGICGVNGGTITNCYYLSSAATGGILDTEDVAGSAEGKPTEQFRSGEVCYLLNSGKTDGSQAWYQNVWGDARPVLTSTGHSTVYQVNQYCGETFLGKIYANDDADEILAHILNETATFNSEKNIYDNVCQREGCGHTFYFADAAGTIEATPNADETAFTVAAYTLADATAYDNACVFTATNFTYTRTFSNSNWTTWYVPFELTLTEDICAHYDFSRINNVHQYDEDNDGTADKTVVESFRQTAGVTLKANYPYLVKPVSDGDMNMMLPLEGVKPALAESNSIDCQSVDFSYTFRGTYADMGEGGSALYDPYTLWTDGTWQHFHSLEPMRHYLTITQRNFSYASPASLSRIMLSVIGDEGTTGIVNIYSDERRAAETYDLSGRRVPAGTSQRGLVIENGKVIYKKQ